ncbi:trypsin-like serine peptidase [Nonomuraea turcica]|uniref:trypsin-like serine peptidase n=1 Tax=Nonomuraea sp. G32 TaxID=3067274 RepID=UPI00273B5FB0|nr:hypothetical protein [Nonomuraea sp. G32]MDP4511401.1 hypothetical protein [Nonomuraea sp. G32]
MKRILIPAGGALMATGLLAAGLAGTAQADTDIAKDPMATSAANAKAIVDYWAESNGAALKAATESNVWDKADVAKLQSKGGYSSDTKPGSTAPIGEEKKTTAKVQNVNLPKTIGKVFFVNSKGEKKWCSATSIQSKYRNLVATAGHCVYDTATNSDVMSKWVFVPGYYQGRAPWGIYVGKQAFTHYDFDVYEDYDRDYAFVTVYNGVSISASRVNSKQVLKSEYDAYEGKKEVKSTELKDIPGGKTAEQQYLEGLDKYGPNGGFRAENVTTKEAAGGNFKDSVATTDEVEVTELQWTNAPKPSEDPKQWKNGDQGATKLTPLTEAEYKKLLDEKAAGKVKGKVFKDDRGDYWLKQFYLIQWYKVTKSTKYFHDSFFIFTGGDITVKDAGRLGDNVGGQGFAWNQPTGKYVRVFGYPAAPHPDGNKAYTGVTPKWCYGKTSGKLVGSAAKKIEEHVALKCAMTEGADGGPWLYKYSNAKRLGYVNGVISTFNDQDGNGRVDYISSPYFDGETNIVYKAAATVWSGKVV